MSETKAKLDAAPLRPRQLARKGPIPNHILDAIAIMSLSGARCEDIADQVGLTVKAVQRLVAEKSNHKFNAIVEGYREKLLKVAVQHKMRLGGMMEAAYLAFERSLTQDRDLRLAKETAKDVFAEVVPKPEQQRPDSIDVNVGFQSIHLQQEVTNQFGETATKFGELIERVAGALGPDTHTKKGPDALPSAYSTTEAEPEDAVIEADFSDAPGPEEPDES